MPFYPRFTQNVFVIATVAIAFVAMTRTSFAVEMSMEAFRAKFQEETTKSWESVDSGEKLDFVRQYQKAIAEALQKAKSQNPQAEAEAPKPIDRSSNLKREATLKVRKAFLAENHKTWDEANAEEQEAFLELYKTELQKKEQQERQRIKKEQAQLKKEKYEKEKVIWQAERKKYQEEMAKLKESQRLKKEREAEKKKLEDTLKRMKKMQEEFRKKRQ